MGLLVIAGQVTVEIQILLRTFFPGQITGHIMGDQALPSLLIGGVEGQGSTERRPAVALGALKNVLKTSQKCMRGSSEARLR